MSNSGKFQTANVLTISFAHMVHDIYSSFVAPILPLLIDKLNLSLSMAGSLAAFQRLPSLLNPLVGIAADKLSVRYFLIISPSITSVAMSLLGMAPGYWALALLVFVTGTSSILFHVPGPVMIRRVSGDRVGKGMSFFMLGGEMARTIGPLVILGAVSLWGLEGTFHLIPFGLLASLLLFFRIRNIGTGSESKREKKHTDLKETLLKYLPFFSLLGGIILSRAFMKAALTAFLPTYLALKGESLWMGGISLSILQVAGAGGTFYCGTISDRIGRRTTLLLVSISSPLLMALFIVLDGIFTLPLLVLIGFSLFASTPVQLALVQDLHSDRPAFLNGIYMSINFLFQAAATVTVGVLGDWLGLVTTYWISALLAFGALPFVLGLKRENTR